MNPLEIIIGTLLLIGILFFFLFMFKADYNTKVLKADIRSGRVDMVVIFFIGEIRHSGRVYGDYNEENDTIKIKVIGNKLRTENLHNIYSI